MFISLSALLFVQYGSVAVNKRNHDHYYHYYYNLIGQTISVFYFSWAWILQNIMVISLALNLLSFTYFLAYKFYSIIVIIYFVYEIFMVFFLPLITTEHKVNKAVGFGMQASIYSVYENNQVIFFFLLLILNNFIALFFFLRIKIKFILMRIVAHLTL